MYRITKEEVAPTDRITNQQNWPIRITATMAADGSPAPVFVYKTNGEPLSDLDFFLGVANSRQIRELTDFADTGPYLKHVLFANCRSQDHAEELWQRVQCALQKLATNLAGTSGTLSYEGLVLDYDGAILIY